MINISGVLTVKNIHGSRGLFAVGELVTDVGTFKVKDAHLDQYDPGRYPGQFLISRIYPSSYVFAGRAVIEVRAEIYEATLDRQEALPSGSESEIERDPIDETVRDTKGERAAKAAPPTPLTTQADVSTPSAQPSTPPDAPTPPVTTVELFGEEIANAISARTEVRLDPTIDRPKFRQQRDQLKSLGYRFDALAQAWTINAK